MSSSNKISFWTATLMNINIMIGVGIFIGPQLMAQRAGGASFLGWPLVALIFLPVVLGVAEMARLFPGAGGFFSYSKNAIGESAGFFSAWLYYLGYASTAVLQSICLRDIFLQYVSIPPLLFNLLLATAIVLLSLLSISVVGRIQGAGTIFKMLPLLLVIAIFVGYWNPTFTISMSNVLQVPATVPMALFGFLGFECCCAISHMISGHPNNAARAILAGFFITTAIYTLFHFGLLHIMGIENLMANRADTYGAFLGITSEKVKAAFSFFISSSLMIAFFNAIFGVFTAVTSTLHSIAKGNLLPFSEKLSAENKVQRPWVCILVQGVITFVVLCLTENKVVLLSISNLGIIGSYLMTILALYFIQKKMVLSKKMITTFLAFASCGFFVYMSWLGIGSNFSERIISVLPLVSVVVIGLFMFSYKKKAVS